MKPALISLFSALVASTPSIAPANSFSASQFIQPAKSSAELVKACTTRTETFLDDLVNGEYKAAFENFDAEMRSKMNAAAFGAFWQTLGPLQSRGSPQGTMDKGSVEITVPLNFEEGSLVAGLSCNRVDKFSGFKLTPDSQPSRASMVSPIFNETEIRVGKPPLELDATLTLPNGIGPFPGVVLVSGAGPHDRDETGGPNKPLRDIAHGLATLGIATLRYDKPTFDHPFAFIGKPYTIDDEFTNPALDAFKLLRSTRGIDPQRVFVLGHSQGGEMAPRIGQREPSIAGLILVNAPAQSLSKYFQRVQRSSDHLAILYPKFATQIRQQAAITEATQKWLATVSPEQPGAMSPDGLPAAYWLSLREYKSKVIATAKASTQPMLIMQGGRDQSISLKDDFGLWQQAFAHDSRVTLEEYPTLSHMMTPAEASPRAADFDKPEHVDPQVIADIAKWIKAQNLKQ